MVGNQLWIAGLVSVVLVSLASLSGAILLAGQNNLFNRVKNSLIALAIGALLGDAFLHLVPEAVADLNPASASLSFVVGFGLFMLFERVLHWQHHHLPAEKRGALPVGKLNLFSDGLHNFIDGIVIGASYLISWPVGLATTLAVILHEIPQELADFAVLVKAGYSKKQALLFNFLSALLAVVGLIAALVSLGNIAHFVPWALGFTAGGFIFMSFILGRDMLRDDTKKLELSNLVLIVLGFVTMYFLTFLE